VFSIKGKEHLGAYQDVFSGESKSVEEGTQLELAPYGYLVLSTR